MRDEIEAGELARAGLVRRLRLFTVGLLCVCLVLAGSLAWLLAPQVWRAPREQADEDIIFPNRVFQYTKAYVYVAGTLTGDWIGYKNNTYSILCLPEECIVADLAQIGPNQVSRINGPTVYPVIKWTSDQVVASDVALCARITITIDRQIQTALYVETPINQTEIECRGADNTIRKATVEHSLYWQRSRALKKR